MMRRRFRGLGFSFIEMVTVVAIIAVVISAATPVASSLFQRRRELMLRETLLVMRQAIRDFEVNQRDDDNDGEVDEDPRGDDNRDGFPGIRGVDDNGDLLVDGDWRLRLPFLPDGRINSSYDWRLRADDDEDMSRDEEAYPSDLFDLVNRTTLLRGRIPKDATSNQPTWNLKLLRGADTATPTAAQLDAANNDLDWIPTAQGPTFELGDSVVLSIDAVFQSAEDVVLAGAIPADGTALTRLVDEDPRNGLDDDEDGRRDEDAPDLADVASLNNELSTNLTRYSSW